MRILDLATYPVARPLSGGQLRLRAVARAYRAARIDVRLCAVYDCRQYGDADIDRWDLPFDPLSSPHHREAGLADDLRAGLFAAEDEATFRQIAAIADRFAPDAIQLEHPWCWPVAERLLARSGRRRPKLIYSAHNVEGPLRRSMLAGRPGAEQVCRLVEAVEAAATRAADLVIAVTAADAEAFRSMGARAVHVFVNGVDGEPALPAALAGRRAWLGPEPVALFVGSGHPPNIIGFMDMLGPALGFLPPDRKIVVVGSVAAPLLADERFRRWEGINRSRIRFTGVIPGADLAALLALAQVIILPITAGGGSNVKTAEALHAGRHVVGTALAFRGFERFLALPGVYPHDDPAGFKQRLLEQLEAPPPSGDNAGLRRDLSWSTTLHDLPSVVRSLGGAG